MQEDTRQRFQGKCLRSMEGKTFMKYYDEYPPEVRDRLMNSPYNLCAACVADFSWQEGMRGTRKERMIKAIDEMEDMIRAGD